MNAKNKDPDALAEKIRTAKQQLADLCREQERLAEKKPRKQPRARGEGSVYQTSYRDRKTGELRLTPNYYIRYRLANGKRMREALDTTSRDEAARILRKRLEDIDAGRPTGPQIATTTVGEVLAGLLTHYRNNKRRSIARVEDSVAHLEGFLGESTKAKTVDEQRIGEYVAHRLREKAANGTVNRELTALKTAFKLAQRSFRVGRVPYITMLREAAPRSGFVERDQHEAILAALPADLRPVLEVAYITGWRVDSEILTREWRHVDLAGGWLRLEPGETKNGQGREFPLTPELRAVLEAQRKATDAVEKATDTVVPLVFHRNGKRIVSFRRSWAAACVAAGLGHDIRKPDRKDTAGNVVRRGVLLRRVVHLIPHDYRRTAVRNLERAGVPRSTAMKLVGHKTESVYRRYAIVDAAMLKEGAEKLAAFHEATAATVRKVLPMTAVRKAR
ncbi:MAG TPA: site-specific integrase [Vicinamibacteria bacterium]|nr:site-specific integrase [Vicinamibacteria bacterium]